MKKPLLIVFSILLVLALAVGAFFYFKPFTQSTLERDQRTTFSSEETIGINASITENEALREDNTVKKENAFFSFMGGATTEIVGPQEVRVGGTDVVFDRVYMDNTTFAYSEQKGLFFDDAFGTQWQIKIKPEQGPNPYLQDDDGGARLDAFLIGIRSSFGFKTHDEVSYQQALKNEYPHFKYEINAEIYEHNRTLAEKLDKDLQEVIRYASSRFPGCDTNDIAIGRYVIAACNVGASKAGTGSDSFGTQYPRKEAAEICPEGYHLPTYHDWKGVYTPFQTDKNAGPDTIGRKKIVNTLLFPEGTPTDYRTSEGDAFGGMMTFDFDYGYGLRISSAHEDSLQSVRCFRGNDNTVSEIGIGRYGDEKYVDEISLIQNYFDLLDQKRRDDARSLLFKDTPSPATMKNLYQNATSIKVREIRDALGCQGFDYNSTEILSLVEVSDRDGNITTYYGERRIYDDRIYVVSTKEVNFNTTLPCNI